jgi:protein-S-isoprenylcysteine O-methyltransferase Ste14
MLLIPNSISIVTNVALFYYVIWLGRIPDEEAMMIREFGDSYKEYINRTASLIPFIV